MGSQQLRGSTSRRLSMKDIAQMAGVDVSTVSRALADSPRVTAETKELVLGIVERTGYVVNHRARTLRSGQSRQVLVMLLNIAAAFFPEVVRGIEDVMRDEGFNVIVGSTQNDPDREEALASQMFTGAVDGLILLTGRLPPIVNGFEGYDRRLVAISHAIGPAIPSVSIDNAQATQDAVAHLYKRGRRAIAHLAGPQKSAVFKARADGYRHAMADLGLLPGTDIVVSDNFDIAAGRKAMQRLLDQEASFDAVLCASDEMAIGAMMCARARGLRLPEDVAFVGFDDLAVSEALVPSLTSIRIPRREMGAVGARMLMQNLDPLQSKPKNHSLRHELIIREST